MSRWNSFTVAVVSAAQVMFFAVTVQAAFPIPSRRPLPDLQLTRSLQRNFPSVIMRNEFALAAWGCEQASTPTLAMIELASGQVAWQWAPERDALVNVYWLESDVFLVERVQDQSTNIWLDGRTGQVVRRFPLNVSPTQYGLQPLETVGIFLGREVYELNSGDRLGELPVAVSAYSMAEHRGQLLGLAKPESAGELILIDLSSLTVIGRQKLSDLPASGREVRLSWGALTLGPNGVAILVATTQTREASRHLAALDMLSGAFLWSIEVPYDATVEFVVNLESAESETGSSAELHRQYFVEWATGRSRIGESPASLVDIAGWTQTDPHVLFDERLIGDSHVFTFGSQQGATLVSLSAKGLEEWSLDAILAGPANQIRPAFSPFLWTPDSNYVVKLAPYEIAVLDPHSGETLSVVTHEDLGLPSPLWSKNREAPGASPNTAPSVPTTQTLAQLPPWLVVFAIAIGCALIYLLARSVMVRAGVGSTRSGPVTIVPNDIAAKSRRTEL